MPMVWSQKIFLLGYIHAAVPSLMNIPAKTKRRRLDMKIQATIFARSSGLFLKSFFWKDNRTVKAVQTGLRFFRKISRTKGVDKISKPARKCSWAVVLKNGIGNPSARPKKMLMPENRAKTICTLEKAELKIFTARPPLR